MKDIKAHKLMHFEDDAFQPYPSLFGNCLVGFIYCFPDGNSVVFSVTCPSDPGCKPAELWILRNVFEHIVK